MERGTKMARLERSHREATRPGIRVYVSSRCSTESNEPRAIAPGSASCWGDPSARLAAEEVARKVTAEAEQAAQEVTLEAERKAARDARYAARKARQW
jgi:hypothetical protein